VRAIKKQNGEKKEMTEKEAPRLNPADIKEIVTMVVKAVQDGGKNEIMEAATKATKSYAEEMTEFFEKLKTLNKAELEKLNADLFDKNWETVRSEQLDIMRKASGLDNDPVIHKSELASILRQTMLELSDSGKRTPAPAGPQSAGPEGAPELTPLEKAVKEFEEGAAK
jgi:hypothetical protein